MLGTSYLPSRTIIYVGGIFWYKKNQETLVKYNFAKYKMWKMFNFEIFITLLEARIGSGKYRGHEWS